VSPTPSTTDEILHLDHLTKHFPVGRGLLFSRQRAIVHAVEDVSISVAKGTTLGIVGESGSGKTTTARMIARLITPTSGSLRFDGVDITQCDGQQLRALRQRIQMVFQDPSGSLNPRRTAGQIIAQPLRVHDVPGDHAQRVAELMTRVGLSPEHFSRYPHEFSGGQRQRIGIARALALDPELIILDEPVSALDVSVQAHILNLLDELQRERHLTYVVISHDLGVIRHISDEIAVMYLGRIVEMGAASRIVDHPMHPYSAALVSATPSHRGGRPRTRIVLGGEIPSPITPPTGCAFHPRCPKARLISGDLAIAPERCRLSTPPLTPAPDGRMVACWYPVEADDNLVDAAHAATVTVD